MPPEPSYDEIVALAHAVDPALRALDVVARKPIQGDAMHKVIGAHAYDALRQVGWVDEYGAFYPLGLQVGRPVYVIEDPDAR